MSTRQVWLRLHREPLTGQQLPEWHEKKVALLSLLEEEADVLIKGSGYHWISVNSEGYPAALLNLDCPPAILFYHGDLRCTSANATLAIVGARRAYAESEAFAFCAARRCGELSVSVVSGLAQGVDGAAHRGALSTDSPTYAVLGAGLSHIYPAQHVELSRQIVQRGGALLSEYPPELRPRAHHFLERNRIIAAFSQATLVIQASNRAGSLTTVYNALALGRDVYVSAGMSGDEAFAGSHELLFSGARFVGSVEHLSELLLDLPGVVEHSSSKESALVTEEMRADPTTSRLLSFLSGRRRAFDEIVQELDYLGSQALVGKLQRLKLMDLVIELPGGYWLSRA